MATSLKMRCLRYLIASQCRNLSLRWSEATLTVSLVAPHATSITPCAWHAQFGKSMGFEDDVVSAKWDTLKATLDKDRDGKVSKQGAHVCVCERVCVATCRE